MTALTLREPRSEGERKGLLHRWMDRQIPSWFIVVISAILFSAIFALRVADTAGLNADAALVLFVIPIAICAIEFGISGGLGSAVLALGIVVGYDATTTEGIGAFGLVTEITTYMIVGGLLGVFVDRRRELEAKVERHFDLSLDLFGTAGFDGYFEDLNPAWEQTLGHPTEDLRSRPLMDLVHPDDHARTAMELGKLVEGAEAASFRNRYRRADGEYRWLEWNVRAVADERRLYATARDITVQQQAEQALQNQSDILERTVRERTEELEESRLETLQRLAITAEYRDDATYQHTERVGRTSALIGRRLGLPEETVTLIRRAAPLHDIGKVGIPDVILLKPGGLTPAEWKLMKRHTEMGARILGKGSFPVLQMAQEISLNHHEHWDGGGYPNGRVGEAIPLVGRIVAVADVFDALTHERPYKSAWSIEDALEEIERSRDTQFDPRVVDAFMSLDHRGLSEVVGGDPDEVLPSLAPAADYVAAAADAPPVPSVSPLPALSWRDLLSAAPSGASGPGR